MYIEVNSETEDIGAAVGGAIRIARLLNVSVVLRLGNSDCLRVESWDSVQTIVEQYRINHPEFAPVPKQKRGFVNILEKKICPDCGRVL